MGVGSGAAVATGNRGGPRLFEPCIGDESMKIFLREPKPEVGLLIPETLVIVALVVDDHHRTAGPKKRRKGPERDRRAGGVVKDPRCKNHIGAAHRSHGVLECVIVERRVAKLDVSVATKGDPLFRLGKLRARTIERDHPVENRGEHIEERAVAGPRIDRETPLGNKKGERAEISRHLRRQSRPELGISWRIKERANRRVSRGDDLADPSEVAILRAKGAASSKGIPHHGVIGGSRPKLYQGTGPLFPGHNEARPLELGDVARHLGLCFFENISDLTDREFFLGAHREQTQPHRLRKHPIELPALVFDGSDGHADRICDHSHGCN